MGMREKTYPEIMRSTLSLFLLQIKALSIHNLLCFDLLDVPTVESLTHALQFLHALQAVDDETNLTKEGMKMAQFPTEPSISKILLSSLHYDTTCTDAILSIAASMHVKSLILSRLSSKRQLHHDSNIRDYVDETGDHITHAQIVRLEKRLTLSESECDYRYINYRALQKTKSIKQQLSKFLKRFGYKKVFTDTKVPIPLNDNIHIRKVMISGFFQQVAKLGNDGNYYAVRGSSLQTKVQISSESIFAQYGKTSKYILFCDTYNGHKGLIETRFVSAIDGIWLREIVPHYWS